MVRLYLNINAKLHGEPAQNFTHGHGIRIKTETRRQANVSSNMTPSRDIEFEVSETPPANMTNTVDKFREIHPVWYEGPPHTPRVDLKNLAVTALPESKLINTPVMNNGTAKRMPNFYLIVVPVVQRKGWSLITSWIKKSWPFKMRANH